MDEIKNKISAYTLHKMKIPYQTSTQIQQIWVIKLREKKNIYMNNIGWSASRADFTQRSYIDHTQYLYDYYTCICGKYMILCGNLPFVSINNNAAVDLKLLSFYLRLSLLLYLFFEVSYSFSLCTHGM